MTNAFGQRISDGMLAVTCEYERWINDPSEDKDIRPLAKAAANHMQLGRDIPLPEFAPCFAILYFSIVDFDHPWYGRAFLQVVSWFLQTIAFRGRPIWNDFYMCLWQLSRDEYYVHRLYRHLKRGNIAQKNTGAWMISSVCQQDEEFRNCWSALVDANGPVFGGPIAI